jgi:hypothetical protein
VYLHLSKLTVDLVGVVPIEFHKAWIDKKKSVHSPRIMRYRDLSFNPHLTQKQLEEIIKKTKMKKKASVHNNSERYLIYQYGGMPTIILDLFNRKICTKNDIIKKFGESACQQQASILLRLLKQHHHANFKRVTVTVNPYRLGMTKEDRDISYKAIESLLRKKGK